MVWVCCVTRQWTLHNDCIPPMHWCLTVMREFYGEEKTDMEWKSSSSSKSAAPKPCWVAHCLDSFTEQWQESSVPQLIHWYCDEYKIWRRCLYFVSTCKLGCLVAKPSPFTDVRFVSCMHRSINVKIEEPYWRRRPGTVTTSLSNSHSSQRDNKYSWVGPAWIPQTSTLQAGMHAKLKSPHFKVPSGGDFNFIGTPAWNVEVPPLQAQDWEGSGWPDPAVCTLTRCIFL